MRLASLLLAGAKSETANAGAGGWWLLLVRLALAAGDLADFLTVLIEDGDLHLVLLAGRLQEEVDHRAVGRVGTEEKLPACGAFVGPRAPHRGGANVEELEVGGSHRVVQLLERRDVVEDPDGAAVGAEDQVVFARVDEDVVHRHGGEIHLYARPGAAAVEAGVGAVFGASEEQVGVARMLADHVDDAVRLRQVRRDGFPRLAEVGGHIDVNAKVV